MAGVWLLSLQPFMRTRYLAINHSGTNHQILKIPNQNVSNFNLPPPANSSWHPYWCSLAHSSPKPSGEFSHMSIHNEDVKFLLQTSVNALVIFNKTNHEEKSAQRQTLFYGCALLNFNTTNHEEKSAQRFSIDICTKSVRLIKRSLPETMTFCGMVGEHIQNFCRKKNK